MFIVSSIIPASTAAVSAVRQAARAVNMRVASILRAIANRRDITQLTHLDDHALKDIGLTRSDVRGALEVSLFDDPSRVLMDIAGTEHGASARARHLGVRRPVVIDCLPKDCVAKEA